MGEVRAYLPTWFSGFPGSGLLVSDRAEILWANPEAERVFGASHPVAARQGLAGLTLDAVIPCALGSRIRHILAAPRRKGETGAERFHIDLMREGGGAHSLDVAIWPVSAAETGQRWIVLMLETPAAGAAPSVRGATLCTGFAALRATEAARCEARQNADILRLSTENSDLVPWVYCPERQEGQIAPHLAAMLGEPGGQSFDLRSLAARIHREDLPSASVDFRALARGEIAGYAHELRLRRADGSWAWFTSRGRRVARRGQGLPDLLCGSLTDISLRKAHEVRLAEALAEAVRERKRAEKREEMLRTSGLCAGVGHFCASSVPGEGWTPDETFRLFGFEPGAFEPTDAGWRSLIHPDDLEEAVNAIEALKAGKLDHYFHEHRRRHADGSYHWYQAMARFVDRSDQGLPPLLAGAIIGIDRAKETERRLAEAAADAQAARARLDTLADNAPGAMFELLREQDGRISLPYFSAKLPELVGVSRAAIEADALAVFGHVPPDALAEMLRLGAAARVRGEAIELRVPVRHPERGLRWLSLAALPQRRADGATLWFGKALDVTAHVETERRAAEAAAQVQQAHDRLASIAAVAPVGLYEVHKNPDGQTTIPYASPSFAELLGIWPGTRIELLGDDSAAREIDPAELPGFLALAEPGFGVSNHRFRIRHPDRGEIWLANATTPKSQPDGSVVWTGALHDVTQDVAREGALREAHRLAEARRLENERQALHDGLTGLPNRRYYDRVLSNRIAEAAAQPLHPQSCTLIRIDLDHFKHVNDTLGHEAGDLVLQRVAEVLRASLRPTDFAARIGGDEFSLLLGPEAGRIAPAEIVRRIQIGLAEPLIFEGRQCRFGASFGLAETDDLAAMGTEIQFFADAALYRAKEAGRNRLEFFTPELLRTLRRDRELASEIQEGLDRDEFVPFFQAQVSAQDRNLTGVETLLRWQHPQRGLLAPDQFMHVAAQLRLVPEIDRVMMEKSRTALLRWRAEGLVVPKISFNVSAGRMHDPDVVRGAARLISDTATRVTFELLESILVEDESEVFRYHLDAVREAGIEIEIDDFGSGHASIIGLMQIAPKALKIDKRIVAPLGRDGQAKNLVRAIIEIAETLGIGTVAEGVETEAQAQILSELGCDILQGFLFSLPLPASDFPQIWADPRKRA